MAQHRQPPTPKQKLVTHLETEHGATPQRVRETHKNLALWHRHQHDAVLTHTHVPDGWVSGDVDRLVPIVLLKPRNPSGSKAEDRNWSLQVSGHENKNIIQIVRLYSTYNGDSKGAVAAAESWLGYSPEWYPTGGGGYEVLGGSRK